MDIYSLNREQINILKGMYLGETQGNASWGELADADKLVEDKEVFEYYAHIDFCSDDFGC